MCRSLSGLPSTEQGGARCSCMLAGRRAQGCVLHVSLSKHEQECRKVWAMRCEEPGQGRCKRDGACACCQPNVWECFHTVPCMVSFLETHCAACREGAIRAAARLALPALRCAAARLARHAAMTPAAQPPSASPISGRCPWLPSRPPLPGAMPGVRYVSHPMQHRMLEQTSSCNNPSLHIHARGGDSRQLLR